MSICLKCERARKTWSDELQNQGYVGCSWRVLEFKQQPDMNEIDADVVAEGWVDLGSRPFTKSSGYLTNMMLITKGTVKCPIFKKLRD
jgi:hypothetical protein